MTGIRIAYVPLEGISRLNSWLDFNLGGPSAERVAAHDPPGSWWEEPIVAGEMRR